MLLSYRSNQDQRRSHIQHVRAVYSMSHCTVLLFCQVHGYYVTYKNTQSCASSIHSCKNTFLFAVVVLLTLVVCCSKGKISENLSCTYAKNIHQPNTEMAEKSEKQRTNEQYGNSDAQRIYFLFSLMLGGKKTKISARYHNESHHHPFITVAYNHIFCNSTFHLKLKL